MSPCMIAAVRCEVKFLHSCGRMSPFMIRIFPSYHFGVFSLSMSVKVQSIIFTVTSLHKSRQGA